MGGAYRLKSVYPYAKAPAYGTITVYRLAYLLNNMNTQPNAYRLLDQITAAFVAVLIISNIASTKIVLLPSPFGGTFAFDGGTLLFPLAYIFGDILTEVYGFQRARRVIWTGFLWIIVTAFLLMVVDNLPPDPFWNLLPESVTNWTRNDSFRAILGQAPQIVLGSVMAYFAGAFTNSVLLAKLKVATNGKHLWLRTISSTVVGQLVDTGVFLVVAFAGVLPAEALWGIFVANYIFKLVVEVAFTPITYAVVSRLKRIEGVDHYDRSTNFNPFALRS
jgi:queuosine precursor transporter